MIRPSWQGPAGQSSRISERERQLVLLFERELKVTRGRVRADIVCIRNQHHVLIGTRADNVRACANKAVPIGGRLGDVEIHFRQGYQQIIDGRLRCSTTV